MNVRPMRKRLSKTGLLCVGLFLGVGPSRGMAEPLPHESRVRVGRPPVAVTVRVDGTELQVRGPGGRATEELPVADPQGAEVETVTLAGGAAVAVVRVKGGDSGRAAALVLARKRRPTIAWAGRLDPHGDPGERRADHIEVADRTGDGSPDVIVGETRESIGICGQDHTLLFPKAVDPTRLELRPVVLRRLPAEPPTGERALQARTDSPGPSGPPILRGLSFRAASSAAGAGEDPVLIPTPVGLHDGDPTTVWTEGHGSEGQWEFVTARFDGGRFPIRAIAVTPTVPDAEQAERMGRLESFWLVGDRGPRLHVELPEDPAARPGQPFWIVPEKPLHWRCLSLVIDRVHAPRGARPGTVRTAVAEVAAYTDLDFGEGVGTLVADLGTPGSQGAQSADLLRTVGARGVQALDKAWPDLGPLARKRAVRALRGQARGSARARALLVRATGEKDPHVHRAALAGLQEAGPAAADALARLVAEGGERGDRAAAALVAVAPAEAAGAVLSAMDDGATERPALRRALARAVQQGGSDALDRVATFVDGSPSPAGAAAAALALGRTEPAQPVASKLVRSAIDRAERFEDRWRLVAATAPLAPDEAVDRWLASMVRDASEWMLRAAALDALVTREATDAERAATAALEDDYPRVRARAAAALGDQRDQLVPVATLARRDPWPLVRQAAVRALADRPKALPVLRAAVHDPAAAVRRTAIETLTEVGDREAWGRVRKRLGDAGDDPVVRSAAIEYARRLCIGTAVAELGDIVDEGLAPDARPGQHELAAEAVRALAALGGAEAGAVLDRAADASAPALLRTTVARAREHEPGCRE